MPQSCSSSRLRRTTSPFSLIFPQLHCYQVAGLNARARTHADRQTDRRAGRQAAPPPPPPPASRNSWIHLRVQGLMCSRPPPPGANVLASFSSRRGPQTGSHDTLLQSGVVHHQQAGRFAPHSPVVDARADVEQPASNIAPSRTEHSI